MISLISGWMTARARSSGGVLPIAVKRVGIEMFLNWLKSIMFWIFGRNCSFPLNVFGSISGLPTIQASIVFWYAVSIGWTDAGLGAAPVAFGWRASSAASI